ncbi:MAG: phosphoglycerate mutase family protein [Acidobacteriota bacterium]
MRKPGAAILFLAAVLQSANAHAQSAVIVVRHAEKVSDADERLSDAGRARAARLATLLKDANVAAIYSTDTERTRDTVKPIAELRKAPVRIYDKIPPLIQSLRHEHANDVVLIVGHSNTVPELLKALGCAGDVAIAPAEYDNLFVVVPKDGTAEMMRLRY